jgi:hypothetical protein
MFFGQFLLDAEVVGECELQEALELTGKESLRIGLLAVERGYLTEDHVQQIQLEQRTSDRRFGEIAIELGLLTPQQTGQLLTEQRHRHRPIGEALVELGHLREKDLDDLLDRYHLSMLESDLAFLGLPDELADDDLACYLTSYLPRLYRRITKIPMKLQPGRHWNGRSNLPLRARATIGSERGLVIGIAADIGLCDPLARCLEDPPGGEPLEEAREGAFREFVALFARAGIRSLEAEGAAPDAGSPRAGELPEGGTWFPATTPMGRRILVLQAAHLG